jgi:hypothetical protein
MRTIKNGIDEFLEKRGLLKKIKGFYPVVKWDDIVGEQLAKYTRPLKYEDGILLIGVTSPLFKRELEGMKNELINIIKEKGGEDTPVKHLRFTLIPLWDNKLKVKKNIVKNISEDIEVELDEKDFQWIDTIVSKFKGDNSLKESYRKVLIAYRIAEKKMEKHGYKKCAKCRAYFSGRGKLCPVCELEDKRE